VQEVPGSFPSQGPRHTKDVKKSVPLFSTQHKKGKHQRFLSLKIMDCQIFVDTNSWTLKELH